MILKALGLAGVAAVAVAIPAAAHHSFAMFDALKIVQLEGTVKEFQWTNPHAWILLNGVILGKPGSDPVEISLQYGWYIGLFGAALIAAGGTLRQALTGRERKPPGVL